MCQRHLQAEAGAGGGAQSPEARGAGRGERGLLLAGAPLSQVPRAAVTAEPRVSRPPGGDRAAQSADAEGPGLLRTRLARPLPALGIRGKLLIPLQVEIQSCLPRGGACTGFS